MNNRSVEKKLSHMCHRSAALALAVVFVLAVLVPGAQAFAVGNSKPLKGKTISIMGDSISTYTGWSDYYPITDPSCTNRYGEAYYGPKGGDFHNTDLLVTDTWWHQAATELGADILMSNAGNSSGLFYASYPSIPAWDLYLKEMLAYKTRPYYMGRDGKSPDIIALYIGSADVRNNVADFGSVDDVDFDSLITDNGDGTISNVTPTTVAESYCILMEKLTRLYPNAEIYCFAVVPQSAGESHLSAFNQRLAKIYPFNDMVRDVAEHYGAHVVELPAQFNLDPDGDGVVTNAEYQEFRQYYNNDPHPNAKGFDMITEAFVSTVMANSKYVVEVETRGGLYESVPVSTTTSTDDDGNTTITGKTRIFQTPNGYNVNYDSTEVIENGTTTSFVDKYSSYGSNHYVAKGGREYSSELRVPQFTLSIPLTATDDEDTDGDETVNTVRPSTEPIITGDPKTSPDDGVYDYRVTYSPKGRVSVRTDEYEITDPIVTSYVHDMKHVTNDVFHDNGGTDMLSNGVSHLDRPEGPEDAPDIPEGYTYKYIGSDQYSKFYSAHVYTQYQDGFANSEPLYSDERSQFYLDVAYSTFFSRKLVVPRLYLGYATPEDTTGKGYPARWDSVQTFTLVDGKGNIASTYCADQIVQTQDDFYYNLYNIEDSDVYDQESRKMMRTIANNGYWGSSTGFGDLASIKAKLEATGNFTQDELDRVTDGIAMTATQYAIWSYSNKSDNIKCVNAYIGSKPGAVSTAVADKADTDLLFKIYDYLTSLEPTEDEEVKNTHTTIINSKNFITDLSVSLTGKPADLPNNQDDDENNDSYEADLSFTLGVSPLENNNDNLVIYISQDGNPIAAGRIAGELQEGEIRLVPKNNTYTLEGVVLSENNLEDICFELNGHQNLRKDVYLYLSENRNGVTSQTMIGITEGVRDVNVKLNISFEIDVEDEFYTEERIWRTETDDVPPPIGPTPSPTPTIPMNVPKTGGNAMASIFQAATIMLAVMGTIAFKKNRF